MKYAQRRLVHLAIYDPMMQPVMAPMANQTCASDLLAGPPSLSAQIGIHCAEPHIPKSAMELITAPRMANLPVWPLKISEILFFGAVAAACCHFFDSGTKSTMKSATRAGKAPSSNVNRQPEFATSASAQGCGRPIFIRAGPNWLITLTRANPISAIVRNPTLAAAPMRPASRTLEPDGQVSITRATPKTIHHPYRAKLRTTISRVAMER